MRGKLGNENLGVTIGNFDGLHLGHQDLLRNIKKDCEKNVTKLLIITFIPNPIKIIKGEEAFLIDSYDERRFFLEKYGVDYLLEINFTRDFSYQTPEEFLSSYLFKIKNIKIIFLGYDFSFGSNKKGGQDLVAQECKRRKIHFEIQREFECENEKVSSTLIRKEVEKGNVLKVRKYLGRPFTMDGSVIKGEGRGRQIGFPTANIEFFIDKKIPKKGVYITKTKYRSQEYFSVTNVGFNPTFSHEKALSVETHILDFNNNIYGEVIKVSFFKRLRGEEKFLSVNELIEQIKKDVSQGREFFKK